jgi:hypothetical protein
MIYSKALPDKSEKTLEWEKKAWYNTLPAFADHQNFSEEVAQRFEGWLKQHGII